MKNAKVIFDLYNNIIQIINVPTSRNDLIILVILLKLFCISISFDDLLYILFMIFIMFSFNLFFIPNVFISLMPLIVSVVKEVNLSCSCFLSFSL